jgi:acetyltransferase-like isoleucine patch superfamily enzyme
LDGKRIYLMARGYGFLIRSLIAGKMVNGVLALLAFLDYRILVFLSTWHPDNDARIKLLRKRGVNIGEHVFVDQATRIEVSAPKSVIIEDFAAIGYGVTIYAHDSAGSVLAGLPLRVRTTRIGYNAAIAMNSTIMPGVCVGKNSAVMPASVVTKDVPEGAVVGGDPAVPIMTVAEIIKHWQQGMREHPEEYFDHPSPTMPPSTPWDDMLAWDKEGLGVRDYTAIRTGTPFDFILDAKAMAGRNGNAKKRVK